MSHAKELFMKSRQRVSVPQEIQVKSKSSFKELFAEMREAGAIEWRFQNGFEDTTFRPRRKQKPVKTRFISDKWRKL